MLDIKVSADNILKVFLFFPENKLWLFMQIVLHEKSKPVFSFKLSICMKNPSQFSGKNKNTMNCCLPNLPDEW